MHTRTCSRSARRACFNSSAETRWYCLLAMVSSAASRARRSESSSIFWRTKKRVPHARYKQAKSEAPVAGAQALNVASFLSSFDVLPFVAFIATEVRSDGSGKSRKGLAVCYRTVAVASAAQQYHDDGDAPIVRASGRGGA